MLYPAIKQNQSGATYFVEPSEIQSDKQLSAHNQPLETVNETPKRAAKPINLAAYESDDKPAAQRLSPQDHAAAHIQKNGINVAEVIKHKINAQIKTFAPNVQTTDANAVNKPNIRPDESQKIQTAVIEVTQLTNQGKLTEAGKRLATHLQIANQSPDYQAALITDLTNNSGAKVMAQILAHTFGRDDRPRDTDRYTLQDRGVVLDAYGAARGKRFISVTTGELVAQEQFKIASQFSYKLNLNIPSSRPVLNRCPSEPVFSTETLTEMVQEKISDYSDATEKVAALDAQLQKEIAILEIYGVVPPELKKSYINHFHTRNADAYQDQKSTSQSLAYDLGELEEQLGGAPHKTQKFNMFEFPGDDEGVKALVSGYEMLANSPFNAQQAADFVRNVNISKRGEVSSTVLEYKLRTAEQHDAIEDYQTALLEKIYAPALERVAANFLIESDGDPVAAEQKLAPYLDVLDKFGSFNLNQAHNNVNKGDTFDLNETQGNVNKVADLIGGFGNATGSYNDVAKSIEPFDKIKTYFPQLPGISKALAVTNVILASAASSQTPQSQEQLSLTVAALTKSPEAAAISLEALNRLTNSKALANTATKLGKIAPTIAFLGDAYSLGVDIDKYRNDKSTSNALNALGSASTLVGSLGGVLATVGVVSGPFGLAAIGAGAIISYVFKEIANVVATDEEKQLVKQTVDSLGYRLQAIPPDPKPVKPLPLSPPTEATNNTKTMNFTPISVSLYEWVKKEK